MIIPLNNQINIITAFAISSGIFVSNTIKYLTNRYGAYSSIESDPFYDFDTLIAILSFIHGYLALFRWPTFTSIKVSSSTLG